MQFIQITAQILSTQASDVFVKEILEVNKNYNCCFFCNREVTFSLTNQRKIKN